MPSERSFARCTSGASVVAWYWWVAACSVGVLVLLSGVIAGVVVVVTSAVAAVVVGGVSTVAGVVVAVAVFDLRLSWKALDIEIPLSVRFLATLSLWYSWSANQVVVVVIDGSGCVVRLRLS